MPPRPIALLLAWSIALLGSSGGCGTAGFFVGVFNRPHAFGSRDGQGAAGLAALILLGAAAVALLSLAVSAFASWKLRARGFQWALWVSGAAPAVIFAVALLLGQAA